MTTEAVSGKHRADLRFTHLLGRSWRSFWARPWLMLRVVLGYIALSSLPGVPLLYPLMAGDGPPPQPQEMAVMLVTLSALYGLGVTLPLHVGLLGSGLRVIQGQDVRSEDLFAGFRRYWSLLLVAVIFMLGTSLLTMLFVLPGIVFVMASWPVVFVVQETKAGAWQSFRMAWRLTSGRRWRSFFSYVFMSVCATLAVVSIQMPAFLTLTGELRTQKMVALQVVLSLSANVIYSTVFALFLAAAYDELTKARGLSLDEPEPAPSGQKPQNEFELA